MMPFPRTHESVDLPCCHENKNRTVVSANYWVASLPMNYQEGAKRHWNISDLFFIARGAAVTDQDRRDDGTFILVSNPKFLVQSPKVLSFFKFTYRPPLQSTYRPHTHHIPTTYPPHTNHIPTTYQPHTNHVPTTYRPHTNHIPTKSTCSLLPFEARSRCSYGIHNHQNGCTWSYCEQGT